MEGHGAKDAMQPHHLQALRRAKAGRRTTWSRKKRCESRERGRGRSPMTRSRKVSVDESTC
eukprot:753055-Lingulodinium_polyedra.AAC.1